MRYTEIVEAPQIIGDQDWNLSNRAANYARAAGILKHKPEVLEKFPSTELVRLIGNVGGQYGLISTRTHLLEYYVHYEKKNIPTLGNCATQIKLWRSRTATVQNLAAKVFDTYLLGSFDTMVSDSRQTTRGREFWEVQISGHSNSHAVGILINGQIKLYDSSTSIGDWLASAKGWGRSPSFRNIQFFISNLKTIVDPDTLP